jgi:hypothetical protein
MRKMENDFHFLLKLLILKINEKNGFHFKLKLKKY